MRRRVQPKLTPRGVGNVDDDLAGITNNPQDLCLGCLRLLHLWRSDIVDPRLRQRVRQCGWTFVPTFKPDLYQVQHCDIHNTRGPYTRGPYSGGPYSSGPYSSGPYSIYLH